MFFYLNHWVNITFSLFSYIFFSTDNVALYMPSYQRFPFDKDNVTYDAANAVDGLMSDLSINGGQCAVSAAGYATAIWRVDLGRVHYIDHITLYFMTDNQPWGKYLIIAEKKKKCERINHF